MKRIILSSLMVLILVALSVIYFSRESSEEKAIRMVKESRLLGDTWTTEEALRRILSEEPGIVNIEGWKALKSKNDNKYLVTFSYEYINEGKIYQLFEVYPDLGIVRHLKPDEMDSILKAGSDP